MAILVLGGAGYIGSHTVYELIDAGRDVVVADNLLTGFRAAVHPKARFYELDIRDRKAVDALFEKETIEGVIHFAASSQVGESMVDPLKYYDNNLWGTTVLLQSMVAHGVDKIVFSSTAATYGEPERVPILESDRTEPTNCYGAVSSTHLDVYKRQPLGLQPELPSGGRGPLPRLSRPGTGGGAPKGGVFLAQCSYPTAGGG